MWSAWVGAGFLRRPLSATTGAHSDLLPFLSELPQTHNLTERTILGYARTNSGRAPSPGFDPVVSSSPYTILSQIFAAIMKRVTPCFPGKIDTGLFARFPTKKKKTPHGRSERW